MIEFYLFYFYVDFIHNVVTLNYIDLNCFIQFYNNFLQNSFFHISCVFIIHVPCNHELIFDLLYFGLVWYHLYQILVTF
jgi:hypothetical protein